MSSSKHCNNKHKRFVTNLQIFLKFLRMKGHSLEQDSQTRRSNLSFYSSLGLRSLLYKETMKNATLNLAVI